MTQQPHPDFLDADEVFIYELPNDAGTSRAAADGIYLTRLQEDDTTYLAVEIRDADTYDGSAWDTVAEMYPVLFGDVSPTSLDPGEVRDIDAVHDWLTTDPQGYDTDRVTVDEARRDPTPAGQEAPVRADGGPRPVQRAFERDPVPLPYRRDGDPHPRDTMADVSHTREDAPDAPL